MLLAQFQTPCPDVSLTGSGCFLESETDLDWLGAPPSTEAGEMMEATASPAGVTEQELKTGLSLMGEGSRRGKINAMMLGFGCMMDDSGQMVVTRVLQESPAAYSGQVGIGDVIDAIDGRMVTSLQLLTDMADGPVWISNDLCSTSRLIVFSTPCVCFRRALCRLASLCIVLFIACCRSCVSWAATCLQEDTLVSLELRRKGDVHSESLHLMRQMPHDASDSGSNDGERAGLGARVRYLHLFPLLPLLRPQSP